MPARRAALHALTPNLPLLTSRILVANNQLFSSSYDRTARAWSVDAGQASQEFRGHRNCVLTLAYSAPRDLPGAPFEEEAAAGGLLVTGSTDGTAKVWQVASGCCHQTLRGHTGAVLCLVLDAPSHTAFTGSTDATVRAWDILSGEQLRVFREHQGSVICLEVRPAVCPPELLPRPRVLASPGRGTEPAAITSQLWGPVPEGRREAQLGLASCEAPLLGLWMAISPLCPRGPSLCIHVSSSAKDASHAALGSNPPSGRLAVGITMPANIGAPRSCSAERCTGHTCDPPSPRRGWPDPDFPA